MTNLPVPVTDEQAKAFQECAKIVGQSIDAAKSLVGWIGKILGTIPEDLVGLAIGDALHIKRGENLVRIAVKAQERLDARSVHQTVDVPPAVAIPLVEAASDENREELVNLWARLLAAAMDLSRANDVRGPFIRMVKSLDPIDAMVLWQLPEILKKGEPAGRDRVGQATGLTSDQVEVAFTNLIEAGLAAGMEIARGSGRPAGVGRVLLTPTGRELLRVLAD
jgi:hypothetical protein